MSPNLRRELQALGNVGAAAAARGPKQRTQPAGPAVIGNQRNYIHFIAEEVTGKHLVYEFDVMAGDTPPTVVDGYGQYAVVDRPLQRGDLQFTGYNPVSLQIPVRFITFDKSGTWLRDNAAGANIERDIRILEYMGGIGLAYGRPPLAFVSTYDNRGQTVPLIPFQYQPGAPKAPILGQSMPWSVTGIDWGNSVRNSDQYRVWQEATVTIQHAQLGIGTVTKLLPRADVLIVFSAPGSDTALKISRTVPSTDPYTLAQDLIASPHNKTLQLRGINQMIKHGRRVYVPNSSASGNS